MVRIVVMLLQVYLRTWWCRYMIMLQTLLTFIFIAVTGFRSVFVFVGRTINPVKLTVATLDDDQRLIVIIASVIVDWQYCEF